MIAALAAAAVLAVPQGPDPKLTPGAINPAASREVICVRGYTSQKGVRRVTAATRRKVFAAYGLDPKGPGGPFELDHLIALELGGSNDAANLWPQSTLSRPWNARHKDRLENKLRKLTCSGKITLEQAQKAISTSWTDAYQQYVGPAPAP